MHSVTPDTDVSPRKRTLSRGISEDESLRSIIKESESSSRRLMRSDSRAGTLKRKSDSQQSDRELSTELPEMMELQASYDEGLQELRGLEVEREALLFQVDVLQDTLESVEELLAEAQREARQASLELEQEREAKKKLESLVCSLTEEAERLKEERNSTAPGPVSTHGSGCDHVVEVMRQGHQMTNAPCRDESSLSESHSIDCRDGVSEEMRQSEEDVEDEGRILQNLQRMVSKPLIHIPSLALDNPFSEDGILLRHHQTDVKDGREPSPDRNDSDSISAYEDASAETPEQDGLFPGEGDTLELPDNTENKEKNPTSNCMVNEGETQNTKNPENCVVS